jgi:flavin-dependent dehydrogenase
MARKVKVAVIGSGLAGLTAAYALTKHSVVEEDGVEFEVHLFEKVNAVSALAVNPSSMATHTGVSTWHGLSVNIRTSTRRYIKLMEDRCAYAVIPGWYAYHSSLFNPTIVLNILFLRNN